MQEKNFFFYKEHKIVAPKEMLTGAEIKALILQAVSSFDPTHTLVLEGHGNDEDHEIKDGDSISVAIGHGQGAKHFFSKPPTNFGGR